MANPARIGVVGAGISGLSTAFYLQKEAEGAGLELTVKLLDRSPSPGGVIHTEKTDGYCLEWGPENFVAFRPLILELIRDLGLANEVIGSNDKERQTFVVSDGALVPLPEGMAFLAPVDIRSFWASKLISPRGKLRACLEPFVPRSKGDLSAYDFLKRRLGRELTEKIGEPLVSAIYGGDTRKLSLASALPETHIMEQRYGSLFRGMRSTRRGPGKAQASFFKSMKGGMTDLVNGLVGRIGVSNLQSDCGDFVVSEGKDGFRVAGSDWEEEYDSLVMATPAKVTAQLLEVVNPYCSAELKDILYTNTWIVYLAYPKKEFSHPLNGFGFVLPAAEAEVFDACTWVSTKFEERCPDDVVLLRCAVHNGRRSREIGSAEELIDRVQKELARLLGFSCQPVLAQMRPALGGMAQPLVNHGKRLKRIDASLGENPGLFLCGAYVSGVGIPSCVQAGMRTAQKVVGRLAGSD
jgi:oxygen-dependent protoporphyrinogen oxidase